jgi:protein involved in polysaccharide export with SLBB domain
MNLFNIRPLLQAGILTFLLAVVGSSALAQINHTGLPNLKLDKLSDSQIMQLWQQGQSSGLSESEGITQLVRMGIDPKDVTSLKKRLIQMQGISKLNNGGSKNLIQDTARFMRDSTWVEEIPRLKRRSRYYGFDYFSNPNPILQPNIRVATPQNYIVGPGDVLSITLTGANIKEIDAPINTEGRVLLEYAGYVSLSGLTLEDATKKIKNKLARIYPALTSGASKINITLSNIRSIRITVTGEAEFPGDYILTAQAGFFNVLYLSNGPSINGSLRKIDLIRNNKVIDSIDFYGFLQNGLLEKNIRLQDQDVIRFRPANKRIIFSGEVIRPGIYELLDHETLANAFAYAGGFKPAAIKDVAKLVRYDIRNMSLKDVALADFETILPKNGDSVFVDKILDIYNNRVVLEGAVYRPGSYELTNQLSVGSLLKKGDGVIENAFLNRGYIKRNIPGKEPALLSFDVQKIINGSVNDIELYKNDTVTIASIEGIQNKLTVSIGGAVKNPGIFTFRRGMQLEDLLLMANGFTNEAANHKVEISRLSKNRADTLSNQLMQLFVVAVDSNLTSSTNKHPLEPLDYIFVPKLLNYQSLGAVKLNGEVLYAGEYALEKRNETLQEVLNKAGGISPYASISDVQVFRNGLRVGTNLENSNGAPSFLLRPSDSIFIPRKEPFVEVKGGVFNPQILSYASTRFMDYISNAGGITDKGNLKKAYVEYSSGIHKKINHFLFFRSYPKIYPGSKIIVPEKTDIGKRGLSIIELSAITGSLSAIISLISVLRK